MKNNPCRYCTLSLELKGKHHPAWKKECMECENRLKHEEYLQSKRMFEKGEQITDISQLLECEWLICGGLTKHIEVFKSMSLRAVLTFINSGSVYKAVRKLTENKNKESEENQMATANKHRERSHRSYKKKKADFQYFKHISIKNLLKRWF